MRSYGGGHAIYTDDAVRLAMKRDVAAFVQSAAPRGTLAASDAACDAARRRRTRATRRRSTTRHQIIVGGRTLRYTARAGLLPIRVNETGEPHGHVFYVAYTLDGPPGAAEAAADVSLERRPRLELGAAAPGRFRPEAARGPRMTPAARRPANARCRTTKRTWLSITDLVFVDPVGTGFSRPTQAEYGAEFYNTLGDIASIAEFVRVYSTRFDAWDAPLFIAGESYGAWRASGVAEALERRGQRVAGVMLISGGIQVGPVIDDELRTALFIPTRAAAAFHHQKLAPDLQKDLPATLRQVEDMGANRVRPGLEAGRQPQRRRAEAIVGAARRGSPVSMPSLIDAQTLIVGRQQFAEQLLRDQKRVLGTLRHARRRGAAARGQPARGDGQSLPARDAAVQDRPRVSGHRRGILRSPRDRPARASRWAPDGTTTRGRNRRPERRRRRRPPRQNLDAPPGGAQPWLRRAMVDQPGAEGVCRGGPLRFAQQLRGQRRARAGARAAVPAAT